MDVGFRYLAASPGGIELGTAALRWLTVFRHANDSHIIPIELLK